MFKVPESTHYGIIIFLPRESTNKRISTAAKLRLMIVLDTNILSEVIRPAPEPAVLCWLAAQPAASVLISDLQDDV